MEIRQTTDPYTRKVAIAGSDPYIFVDGCRDGHFEKRVGAGKYDEVGVRLTINWRIWLDSENPQRQM